MRRFKIVDRRGIVLVEDHAPSDIALELVKKLVDTISRKTGIELKVVEE